MSIKIMSLVFDATIPTLQYVHQGTRKNDNDDKGYKKGDAFEKMITVEPPRSKLILLAYADHANDDGISAYPGLTRLENKTGLSRVGVVQTKKALIKHGYLVHVGESGRHTDDMNIVIEKLASKPSLPPTSKPSLPELVNPVYPNHPEPSLEPPINGSRPTPKKKKERDARLDHQAIIIFREMTRYHAPIITRDDIINAVGNDTEKWKTHLKDWIARGYNPRNVKSILETFKNGFGKGNGYHGKNKSDSTRYQPAEYTADDYAAAAIVKARTIQVMSG